MMCRYPTVSQTVAGCLQPLWLHRVSSDTPEGAPHGAAAAVVWVEGCPVAARRRSPRYRSRRRHRWPASARLCECSPPLSGGERMKVEAWKTRTPGMAPLTNDMSDPAHVSSVKGTWRACKPGDVPKCNVSADTAYYVVCGFLVSSSRANVECLGSRQGFGSTLTRSLRGGAPCKGWRALHGCQLPDNRQP